MPASHRRERSLLGPHKQARIYAIASSQRPFDAGAEPLLLVHGLTGTAAELAPIASQLGSRYQPYVLAYDDFGQRTSRCGDQLATAFTTLALGPWRGRKVTILAHSLGGIVARRALNRLAMDPAHPLDLVTGVRLIAIDTPWHGFWGPADTGAAGVLVALARPFVPDGLEDLRARSALFQGDPASRDPVERRGLWGTELPDGVEIDLVFAEQGKEALDYTEGALAKLPEQIARLYAHDIPVRGDARLMNFWHALTSSSQYGAFRAELEPLALAGRLDASAVRSALARHFQRYPGNHMSVLSGARAGLAERVARTW